MSERQPGVRVVGLAKLNRDLGRISKDFRRDTIRHLREIGNRVRGTARSNAEEFRVTGELERSLRVSATNRGTAITSRLPQGPVIEFGGTISPRGTPFTIEPHLFVNKAIDEQAGDIDEQLGDLLDRIARSDGFQL